MPQNSSKIKIDATRSYGAEIVFCGNSFNDREHIAGQLQEKLHCIFVHPFDDELVIAGQGTIVIEIREELDSLDYLFVPVGGGGLISGCAIAAKHLYPHIKVIGVETEPANDCQQSFRCKKIVRISPPQTIADGMRTQAVGIRSFEIILRYVDDVVTVTDEQVIDMMRFFFQRMKIVVEPTGAVASAAIYHNILNLSHKRIGTIISGGNVEPSFLKQWL